MVQIVSSIHSGRTIEVGNAGETYSEHLPQEHIPPHVHVRPHWMTLVSGAFLERSSGVLRLVLPGDEVYYAEDSPHEELFGRIRSVCLNLQEPQSVRADAPSWVARARDLAESAEVGRVSDLAQAAGVHRAYLARRVKAQFNTSLRSLRRSARLKQAAELVFTSDEPLGSIALEAGYYDQSHLNRDMTRWSGFTPGELRRYADQGRLG